MNIIELATHIVEVVANSPSLSAAFPVGQEGKWLCLGVADTFPAITIDGIVDPSNKQGVYSFNLNLILRTTTGSFDESAQFYALVAELQERMEQSHMLIGGDWRDRPETGFNRALFPCRTA